MPKPKSPFATPLRIVRGAKNIAAALQLDEPATYHKLEKGYIPGARKEGAAWVLNLDVYDASFRQDKRA